jgi:hypothetical protein
VLAVITTEVGDLFHAAPERVLTNAAVKYCKNLVPHVVACGATVDFNAALARRDLASG